VRLLYRGVRRQEKIRFMRDIFMYISSVLCERRQKKADRKCRKTAIRGKLAVVQNVSRFGAGSSGGGDADDVESVSVCVCVCVCDDIRRRVSHVQGLSHLHSSGRLEPRARL
jgi:hypothetical protein